MRLKISDSFRALLLIALPLVAVGLGMAWSTARMLNGISESVDAQEHARAWDAIKAAFKSSQDHLAGTMADNAQWDDAVENVYGTPNMAWIEDTWGTSTVDVNYNVAFIVRSDGSTVVGYRDGEQLSQTAAQFFGPLFPKLLAALPGDSETFETATTLAHTDRGLMSVAAGPIVPYTHGMKAPVPAADALIFGRLITPDDLARMGRTFIVDGLKLTPGKNEGAGGSVLYDAWGAPVATAFWQDRKPGAAARQSYARGAIAILFGLVAVILPLAAAHFKIIRKLAGSERRARHDARHDALTGLPNRVAMGESVVECLDNAELGSVALLYIDLDGFKAVNDTYDHATGDRLLHEVAKGFGSLLGANGSLARLGGDEFAIVVRGPNARNEAETLAANILAFVRNPVDIDGRIANIGASIGIATNDRGCKTASELMRRADVAMYACKADGRNQWSWYQPIMDGKRSENIEIANEMRTLIARGHFEVAYQPIVDSTTRSIVAVEALARWPQSSQRRLAPDVFIPIAEEHGLIDDLGDLILRIACTDLSQWQDIRLAVNVSPVQLNNPRYVPRLESIVAATGFDLKRLEIEFTETVLIRNTQRAREIIDGLHTIGVTVALDDFGTGFASVGYLRAFRFDKVKLDRSLTQSILTDIEAQRVVQGTVLIARGLSAEIIAEGVETEEEAQLMRLSGCQKLQGYYFGRPQAAAALGTMLPHEDGVRVIA